MPIIIHSELCVDANLGKVSSCLALIFPFKKK